MNRLFRVWISGILLLTGVYGSSIYANSAETSVEASIVVRADSPDRRVSPENVVVATGRYRADVLSVTDTVAKPLTIALVIDVGPNQTKVLDKEKAIASSLITTFSEEKSSFLIIRAGFRPSMLAGHDLLQSLQQLTAEPGKGSNIPIYDAVALAFDELSRRDGMRVVVVIAEGNDSGSHIRYRNLQMSAMARHSSVMTLIVADHPTTGSKGIYTYGWNLRDLSSKTAGISIDNDRNTHRALRRLSLAIRSLRLVSLNATDVRPGRYKVHLVSDAGHLHVQKQVCVGRIAFCTGYEEQ